MTQDRKKRVTVHDYDHVIIDEEYRRLIYSVCLEPLITGLRFPEYSFPRKREDLEATARLTRRRELPGLIKMKFMRAPEKLAHVEIATFRASVVNPVHN